MVWDRVLRGEGGIVEKIAVARHPAEAREEAGGCTRRTLTKKIALCLTRSLHDSPRFGSNISWGQRESAWMLLSLSLAGSGQSLSQAPLTGNRGRMLYITLFILSHPPIHLSSIEVFVPLPVA